MKILLTAFALIALAGCGEDADVYQDSPPTPIDYNANLEMVRQCIESGGEPEYATGTNGVVTVFYGCRPAN